MPLVTIELPRTPKVLRLFSYLSGAESVTIGTQLTELSIALARASIRAQHPRWTAKRCDAELRRLIRAAPGSHGTIPGSLEEPNVTRFTLNVTR